MNDRTNKLNDTVNVSIHKAFIADKSFSYAKVQRNTAYIGNIIDKILEKNNVLDRETLLYAAGLFRNGIFDLLKDGKSVDVLETGVLYIKPVKGIEKANPAISDVPDMTLGFTPSESALEAIKKVVVGANITGDNSPVITELYDMFTRTATTELTSNHSVRISGRKLKIAGESQETGVFFASCDDAGKYDDNISSWIHIEDSMLIDNRSVVLTFNLPAELTAGKYRLIVRTAYGSRTRINKSVRTGLFEHIVTIR